MWKLMTGDGRLASRSALIPHAVSATFLLFAGLLVVGLAQMGGGGSVLPSPRTYLYSGCSSTSTNTTALFSPVANKVYYYTPKTATVTRYITRTKTVTRTKTTTLYRTRTKIVCRTTTVTGPGSTTTVTSNSTETTTEPGPTTTVTTTVFGPPISSTIN